MKSFDTTSATSSIPDAEFVQAFTRNQRRLFLYILAQVPNPFDAEEILQETNVVVWRKATAFQPGTNFLAWARRIADYEVLQHRQRHSRDRLLFSQEFVAQIVDDALTHVEDSDVRRRALLECLGKLRPKDRELIRRRYAPGGSGKKIAEWLGRPVNSVYQSLSRIRQTLLECIRRELAAEAGL